MTTRTAHALLNSRTLRIDFPQPRGPARRGSSPMVAGEVAATLADLLPRQMVRVCVWGTADALYEGTAGGYAAAIASLVA